MLMISKEHIKQIFTMKEAIEAAKLALNMYSAGSCNVPLRVNIDMPKQQGQSLFMPAFVEPLEAAGIKIVSVFPNNIELGKSSVPAQMIVLDGKTGEVCAIIDGTYLTQLRTGAVQGAATDLLARKDAKTAVLIGTGGQAGTQLEAMLNVRELEEVHVYDVNIDRARAFTDQMRNQFADAFHTRIVVAEDLNAALSNADIVTAVTTSPRPVFDGTRIKAGAHINGVGAYTPQMQELPEEIVKRADTIIFDTIEGVLAEAGDIIIPLEKGIISRQDIAGELGQVLLGQIKGREREEDITLFKTVGTAVLDVVTAQMIYRKALEMGVGIEVTI